MRPDETGMPATRVILDTNIFVAAGFNPGSRSARILAAVREGRLRMVWSETTRGETERIIRKIPPLAWADVADLFREADRFDGEMHPERFDVIPDPADRPFAALAAATGATLVSLDDHLLAHRAALGLPIVRPDEL